MAGWLGWLVCLMVSLAGAQTPPPTPMPSAKAAISQNPSPMVEHTRAHPRLEKTVPEGERETLSLGTLFVPKRSAHVKKLRLMMFFLGSWVPEVAVAKQRKMAVISITAGAGSSTYEKLFEDPTRFGTLVAEAEEKSGKTFGEIELGGFSAGCGAERKLLRDADTYARVARVLCMDGVHTGYVDDQPGPMESNIEPENLQIWLKFGRDAIAGKKRMILTHTEIFPGTFASTTETADYLLKQWDLKPHPVVKWGPMRTQMLSRVKAGKLMVVGFAGNSAPDHIDQLHSLPEYLAWLMR